MDCKDKSSASYRLDVTIICIILAIFGSLMYWLFSAPGQVSPNNYADIPVSATEIQAAIDADSTGCLKDEINSRFMVGGAIYKWVLDKDLNPLTNCKQKAQSAALGRQQQADLTKLASPPPSPSIENKGK